MADDPSPTLSVTVGGTATDVFMSYGMMTELARTIPSIEDLPLVVIDNDARDKFLNTLLAEREKGGKILNYRKVSEIEVSMEDIERLLDWGQEHLMGFFVRRVQKAKGHAERIQTTLGTSSSDGMPA